MHTFSPYTIEHLQLKQLDDELVIPSDDAYLVFWSDVLPLGHLWYKAADKQNIKEQINKVLRPVLSHYLSAPEWEHLLEEGKYSDLSLLLNGSNPGSVNSPQQSISVV